MAKSPQAQAGHAAYFGRCFGWLHPAAGLERSGLGAVFCGPNGYEGVCVHRPWGRFAADLAAAGIPTLRFDYPGCGDAPEDDEDPARVRAWLDGVHEAVAFLRRQTGVSDVALVGFRIGAVLAAVAAQELARSGNPAAALVLLAPPVSGESFYKELRVLSMMAKARGVPGADAVPGIEAAGFHYTPETVAEMRKLAPAKDETLPAPRILILDRPDGSGGRTLGEAFRQRGAVVEVETFAGYAAFMTDAADTVYPETDFDRAIAWLQQGAKAGGAAPTRDAVKSTLPLPGGVERIVTIGPARLFGILAEPERPAAGRPVLLILNTGANHRVNTNRLGVLIARRLLREGVAVLRIDLGGIGDSPSVPERPDRLIMKPELVEDVRQVVAWLAERGHGEIVTTGLCAGAWLSYHAAVAEPRITGQILLNVQNLWEASSEARNFESNKGYLRRALKLRTWLRLVKGEVRVRDITHVLLLRLREATASKLRRLTSRAVGAETVAERTKRELRLMASRRTQTAFVYCSADPGIDEMELHFGKIGRALAVEPGVSMIMVEDADHLFSMKVSRDHLMALMAAQFATGRFVPTAAVDSALRTWAPHSESKIA